MKRAELGISRPVSTKEPRTDFQERFLGLCAKSKSSQYGSHWLHTQPIESCLHYLFKKIKVISNVTASSGDTVRPPAWVSNIWALGVWGRERPRHGT